MYKRFNSQFIFLARLKLSAFQMLRRNQTNNLDESIKRSQDLNRIIAIGAFIVVLLALALCAWGGEPEAKTPIAIPSSLEVPAQSLIHRLLNIDLSEHCTSNLTIFL
jgi:hypothetical protein